MLQYIWLIILVYYQSNHFEWLKKQNKTKTKWTTHVLTLTCTSIGIWSGEPALSSMTGPLLCDCEAPWTGVSGMKSSTGKPEKKKSKQGKKTEERKFYIWK